MKKKHFKSRHALLMSLTSLTLCVSMLFGATFAWFTDSVTSGVNRIVSGNLDVELYHRNSDVTANTPVGSSTQLFNSKISEEAAEYELWEPGAVTYEVFTVENRGTLALKYQLNAILANIGTEANPLYYNTVMDANGNNTGANLTQVLRVKEIDGDANLTARPDYTTSDGITLGEYLAADHYTVSTLQPNETKTTTIVLFWPQSAADNTWNLQNGKYASDSNAGEVGQLKVGLAINLVATQYTSEADSFGIDYDAAADGVNSYELATAIDSNVSKTLAASNISATANATEYTALVSTPEATTATTISDAAATSTIPANTTATLTLGENQSIDVGTDKMTALSREIRTTENSSNSVTYDISYNATVTTTTGEEQTATATYAVHTFDKIVTNEINVGTGLLNVSVTHGSAAMNKLTTNGVPANPNEKGDFYYDAGTGKLYIYSKTYSEYKVSFEQAEVSVVNNGTTTNMTLAAFRTGVNDGTYANATVTLLRDVTLTGTWTPIGTSDHPFTGTFDGKGHTINGLTINDTTTEDTGAGLFGTVQNATVQNMKIVGAKINVIDKSGVVCGFANGACVFNNISVDSTSEITGQKNISGLVGYLKKDGKSFVEAYTAIKNCSVAATITGTSNGSTRAAGFVAAMNGPRILHFENCTFSGTVNGSTRSSQFVGIAQTITGGSGIGSVSAVILDNCSANGTVTEGTENGVVIGWTQYANRHIILNQFKINGTAVSGNDYAKLVGYSQHTGGYAYGIFNTIQIDGTIVGFYQGNGAGKCEYSAVGEEKSFSYDANHDGNSLVLNCDYALCLNDDYTLTYKVNKMTLIHGQNTGLGQYTKFVGNNEDAKLYITCKESGDNYSSSVEDGNFYNTNGEPITVFKTTYTGTDPANDNKENTVGFEWDSTLNGWRLLAEYSNLYPATT